MSTVSWYIAWRHLFSSERKTLVSAITVIATTGVAIGVAALIVVIGVMDGALDLFHQKVSDVTAHVQITSRIEPTLTVTDLVARLRRRPEVRLVTPLVNRMMVIQSQAGIEAEKQGVQVIGADQFGGPQSLYRDPDHPGQVVRIEPGEVLLSRALTDKLQVKPNGRVLLINAAALMNGAAGQGGAVVAARVKGSFSTGFYEFDANTVLMNAEDERRIFGLGPDEADAIDVRLHDPDQAGALRDSLQLPPELAAVTWQEQSSDLFAGLRMQKVMMFIILLLITVVAAFNVIGTLILVVIDKTREIGILRAVGGSRGLIARIYLLNGMLIGLFGTVSGVVLGIFFSRFVPLVHVAAEVYNFDRLPVKIQPLTVLAIVAASLAISTFAALIPAVNASRLNPVEALRYD